MVNVVLVCAGWVALALAVAVLLGVSSACAAPPS
jgi:hypothetical protein